MGNINGNAGEKIVRLAQLGTYNEEIQKWINEHDDNTTYSLSNKYGKIVLSGSDGSETSAEGEVGPQGPQGEKGDKGDKGEKGDAFTFEDFTPEQLESLRGPQGIQGEVGPQGPKGQQGPQGQAGEKGEPFKYEDFTPEQLTALKGEKGDKGDKGDPVSITVDNTSYAPDVNGKIDLTNAIPDVSNFITKAVNDLTNYYTKSETYTQREINQRISEIPKFAISVVESLPTTGISATTVYLLTGPKAETGNLYSEYIYVNNQWELLGIQNIDLQGYATTQYVNNELAKKQDSLTPGSNISITNNTISATYSNATQSASGLMSSADKKKLDGIATGAEVNQNAFSSVVVGSTTIAADSKTDALILEGNNVTITPDATNDKITIGITKNNVTSALGYTPPTTDTWRGIQNNLTSDSTTDSLSAAQGKVLKDLVDGKAAASHTHTKSQITDFPTKLSSFTNDSGFLTSSSTLDATKLSGTIPSSCYTDTTYSEATTSSAGLMSATDKTRLNNLFQLKTYTATRNSLGSLGDYTFTISHKVPTGYTTVGIVSFDVGNTQLVPIRTGWDTGSVYLQVHNGHSSAISSKFTVSVTVLYIRKVL